MNTLIRYFDLVADVRPRHAKAKAAGETSRELHWLPQYIALLLGIVVQPFIQRYMTSGAWNLAGLWGWVAASAFIAVVALPAVYRRSFDPEKPLPVQLAVMFSSGMGWQSLVGAALKGLQPG